MRAQALRVEARRVKPHHGVAEAFPRLFGKMHARLAILDRLQNASRGIPDDRPSRRHGLHGRDAEILHLRIDKRPGVGKETRPPSLIKISSKSDRRPCHRLETLIFPPMAKYHQRHPQLIECRDDQIKLLALHQAAAGKKIAARALPYRERIHIHGRINDAALPPVIMADARGDRLRICEHDLRPLGGEPVPDTEFREMRLDKRAHEKGEPAARNIRMRVRPKIARRRMAIAHMKRMRLGNHAFGKCRCGRKNDIV